MYGMLEVYGCAERPKVERAYLACEARDHTVRTLAPIKLFQLEVSHDIGSEINELLPEQNAGIFWH